jgi:hypothetical protein
MTVSSTINREQYSTDGVTTAFAIHFPFFDDTDVNAVYVDALGNPTPLALNADYTVSGGGGAGGTLTALAAPAGGGALTIYREIPFTQEDDYVEDDPLPADTLEGGFDRAVMRDQQLKDAQDRALTLPVTIPAGVSAVLPFPVVDSFLGWNATGTGLENKTLPDPSTLVKATPSQAVNGANDTAFMTPAMTKAALQGVEYDTGQVSTDAGAGEGPTDAPPRRSSGWPRRSWGGSSMPPMPARMPRSTSTPLSPARWRGASRSALGFMRTASATPAPGPSTPPAIPSME